MKRLSRLMLIILSVGSCMVAVVICAPLIEFVIVTSLAPQMARNLAPPEYPGSQLIKTYQPVGTETMGDWRTYRTGDSVDKVLAYMEEHMPGFTKAHNDAMGTFYQNSKEDRSDLAKRAADYACSSLFCTTSDARTYPSVGVVIYPDPDNSTGTLIDFLFAWPAP